ncbi:MAG: hypothetical protein WBK08_00975 [Nitrospira sp.]|jgi:hypothetical protein
MVRIIAGLIVFCFMAPGNWLCGVGIAQAQVRGGSPSAPPKPQSKKPLDPMNRPMDELGVTGKDDTLCSDRWYSCTSYDRQQFDQKYPGQPLKDLLRYGEPDWPDKPCERQDWNNSLDYHDKMDKD